MTTFSKLPKDIDILTYSFPCQDLSQQGKQKGLNESTRSGLLYQIERILKSNQDRLPKILLLENVKGLVSKKFINDFNKWIETLDKLGYSSKYAILNATDYGSSQNRERVFMLSVLKTENKDITFPPTKPSTKSTNLEDIINNPYANNNLEHLLKYKHTDFKTTSFNITKAKLINYSNFNSESYIYKPINKGATLTASGANSRLKFYFQQENIIRYINEIEAYLYMGFSENDVLKIKSTNLITPTKMIFCAGNSICIQVLEAIFKEIKKAYEH
ncbi:DNA (cytosine-5-)-methyltransferase [Ureaplasma diversum]|uniref:DNA (cytosine-5-)-methyltransferase n=2 Tax=Ureaplasma diversum TaxID=42094 RepID=UPI002455E872|nr:DNA (cytosine-5-)-methyltransferase [Ureaplasma diversum]